jgi:hypothetical protein
MVNCDLFYYFALKSKVIPAAKPLGVEGLNQSIPKPPIPPEDALLVLVAVGSAPE